jgi:hypothetical protein
MQTADPQREQTGSRGDGAKVLESTVTSVASHVTVPATISARMPVKCIKPMPRPTMAPPIAISGRDRPEHTKYPKVVATIATSSDPAVSTGS